jgi:hypothetical protein
LGSVRDLLSAVLRRLGCTRVVVEPGQSVGELANLTVADPDLARLLCQAAGRLGPGPGALVGETSLRISWGTGRADVALHVSAPDELVRLLAALEREHQSAVIRLDVDLDAPAHSPEWPTIPLSPTPTLHPDLAGARGVIVAGPGVVRCGRVDDLVTLARRTGWGVINTWGAKGLLTWSDPCHFGTAGLQAHDLDLAGVADAELVIATGIDAEELPPGGMNSTMVLEVHPEHLATLTFRWESPPPDPPLDQGPLYRLLAAVVGPWYEDDSVPANPARLAHQLSAVRPPGGVVATDAGTAGFWVGRTFPTPELGAVVLPAVPTPGFAVAVGLLAGLDGRPAVAVTDHIDPITSEVAGLGASLGVSTPVQVWSPEAPPLGVVEHARLSVEQFAGAHPVVEIGLAAGMEQWLIEVAGPIVAWDQAEKS